MKTYTYYDGWINGDRVQVIDWLQPGEIYINIQQFRPGSSIHNPLVDKSFIVIPNHPEQLEYYIHSIVARLTLMEEKRDNSGKLIPIEIILPEILTPKYLQEAM